MTRGRVPGVSLCAPICLREPQKLPAPNGHRGEAPRRACSPKGRGKDGIRNSFWVHSPCSLQIQGNPTLTHIFSGAEQGVDFPRVPLPSPHTPRNQAACASPPPGGWSSAGSGSWSCISCLAESGGTSGFLPRVSTGPSRCSEI